MQSKAVILPRRLAEGKYIGVVALSDPVCGLLQEEQLRRGVGVIEALGFGVKVGRYVESQNPYERALDFNTFLTESDISAIIAAKGGDSAHHTLSFIDWDSVSEYPKILLGFSDITVFLNAIYQKTGLITFHGGDVCFGFGKTTNQYDKQEFINRLSMGKGGIIQPNGKRDTVRGGNAKGKLLGGNLRCLLKLAGTEFFPDFTDAILFLESYIITPYDCKKYLKELRALSVFEKIKGAIVGFVYSMEVKNHLDEQMEDILNDLTAEYGFPILKMRDFGHRIQQTIIPLGVTAKLDATTKTVELTDSFLV
ncbi:MAG: LD-carboxypeptidase [Candidatus Magnetoovum sp. WYHC-5]|nr:LD-carboxypeptidase [Candidatus Magnetoovum sp. WYHC-5]